MRSAINPVPEELEETAAFCRSEGLGVEVTARAWPHVPDGGELPGIVARNPGLRGTVVQTVGRRGHDGMAAVVVLETGSRATPGTIEEAGRCGR